MAGKAWQKIVDGLGLDDERLALLKRFVLQATRLQPGALWVYGPSSSGKSALVRALTAVFSGGSVARVSGYDLRRGRFALSCLYGHVARTERACYGAEAVADQGGFETNGQGGCQVGTIAGLEGFL